MSKIEEIIKLKKLLDECLISQSDFETLKKNLFDDSEYLNVSSGKSIGDGNKNNIKKCSDCGNNIRNESNDCEYCIIKSSDFIDEKNKSSKKILVIIVSVLLLILLIYSLMNNTKINKSEESIPAQDTIQNQVQDTINIIEVPQEDTLSENEVEYYENYSDTSSTNSSNYTKNIIENNSSKIIHEEYNFNELPFVRTPIKINPNPINGSQNVFFNKNFTLFDQTKINEPIYPVDKNGTIVYQIYYSSNEDPKPYYGEFTPEQLEKHLYYKFKNKANCMVFCNSKK